jgi:cytochrome c-type protein NapC
MMVVFGYIVRHWKVMLLCGVFGVLGILFSLATAEGIHATSGAEFCVSCHVMEPMVAAYEEDLHGGKNAHGIRAECTDCHLPHKSVLGYVVAKGISGMKDIWGNVVLDPTKIDWEERRSHREKWVYDSGCLSCHAELEEATMSNMKAFLPHRDYFMGNTNKTCVACHENVGHKNLGLHLKTEK